MVSSSHLRRRPADIILTENDTRRQAATDFTRALMEHFDTEVTEIIKGFIATFLQDYASDPKTKWKSKDTAIYLLTSIASRGSTQHVSAILCLDRLAHLTSSVSPRQMSSSTWSTFSPRTSFLTCKPLRIPCIPFSL